jgi:hypothetical protein
MFPRVHWDTAATPNVGPATGSSLARGTVEPMKSVVATFAIKGSAATVAARLRLVLGLPPASVATATVAAYREPWDGHDLLAAWVADDQQEEAEALVTAAGGTLAPQPSSLRWPVPAAPPRS